MSTLRRPDQSANASRVDATRELRRAFITGIGGSGGSYLAEYIVEHHPDVEVHGFARWRSTATERNLAAIRDRVTVHEGDLTDLSSVLSALQAAKPDVIFHLAAHANVAASFRSPAAVLQNNVQGTINLLESVRLTGLDSIIQICSSSEVYGRVDVRHVPISEEAPLAPVSPYAVSKAAQDLLGLSYFISYDLRVIRTRMFAYFNPRRADLFATSFAKQVAWIERGLLDELVHGNLDSVRTLIDVRDAMRAYWEAVVHCDYGEVYNIGGTTTMRVGDVLEHLISMSDVPVATRLDPALLRPADVTLQIPNVAKFRTATGWEPQYSLEESLRDLLTYWRERADEANRAWSGVDVDR